MATVGQALTTPETGWKRYDGADVNISGVGNYRSEADGRGYGSTTTYGEGGAEARFNFVGTQLRIIGDLYSCRSKLIDVYIDGTKQLTFSQYATDTNPFGDILNAEISGIPDKEHYVRVVNNTNDGTDFLLDAIDIDETGELKPYSPIASPTDLTAMASDSRVTLSWGTVTGASGYNIKRSTTAGGPYTTIASNIAGTTYVDTSVTNGTTYYYIVTAILPSGESSASNEASATPQAASKQLLRVTVIDSSDHDYQLSSTEIDDFVNWFMKHTSSDTVGYMLNKVVGTQESKEYLAFDKIISFEIMQLTK